MQHHFLHQIFCNSTVCVTNICKFVFDSKETTHAEINVQNFVTQKMLMQNFLLQKNTCKNKLSKVFDYLVRVHNDKGLKLCEREGTGERIFIFWPFERSHKQASTLLQAAVHPEAFVLKFQFCMLPVPSGSHNFNPLSLWTRTK